MQLVPDIHNFWRWWSVRLAFASGLISTTGLAVIGAYALLPADWLPAVPVGFKLTVSYAVMGSAAATALLSALARGVKQNKLDP